MDFVRNKPLTLVLSEGEDRRVIGAASDIVNTSLAKSVVLVGNAEKIKDTAKEINANLNGVDIIDPEENKYQKQFAEKLVELSPKEYNEDNSVEAVKERLMFGTLYLEAGLADIHVAGAVETSANVIKTSYHIIKTNRKEGVMTSFFLMNNPTTTDHGDGVSLFSDCAVNISPSPKFLAKIALQVGNIAKNIFNIEPKLALLTYSTKGSGSGDPVDHIIETGKELDKLKPEFMYEVEMQIDAALDPEISSRKAPGNKLNGEANVLIFPNLESGNIGYKLVENFSNTTAYGPILVGLRKTVSDLSRGCTREAIVGTYGVAAYYHLKKQLNK